MDILKTQTMKDLKSSSVYASLPKDRNKSTLGKKELCRLMVEHTHAILPSRNTEIRTMHVDLRNIIPVVETPDGRHIPADGATEAVYNFCDQVVLKPSRPFPSLPKRYISFGLHDVTSPDWQFPEKLWTDGFRSGDVSMTWPGRMLTGNNKHGPPEPFENRPEKLYFNVWEPAHTITYDHIEIERDATLSGYPADCDAFPDKLCVRNYIWYDEGSFDAYIWTPTTKLKFGLHLVTNVAIHNPFYTRANVKFLG
jgi:hypothetical protein